MANETPGLNVDRWNEARGFAEPKLEATRPRAQVDRVSSTPTLVISGPGGERKLVGAASVDEVEAAIEEIWVS
jgi:protein-disulfide isomerase